MIAIGMAICALGAGSVAAMSTFDGFLASMIVLTLASSSSCRRRPSSFADLAPADMRGRYMSVSWLGWAASRAATRLVGGFLNDRIGPHAIWYGALALGMASTVGLAGLIRALRGRSIPSARHNWEADNRRMSPMERPDYDDLVRIWCGRIGTRPIAWIVLPDRHADRPAERVLVATERGLIDVTVAADGLPIVADRSIHALRSWSDVATRIRSAPGPASMGHVSDLVLELDGLRLSLTPPYAASGQPDTPRGTFESSVVELTDRTRYR